MKTVGGHTVATVNVKDSSGSYMSATLLHPRAGVPWGAFVPPGIKASTAKPQSTVDKRNGNVQGAVLKNLLNAQGN